MTLLFIKISCYSNEIHDIVNRLLEYKILCFQEEESLKRISLTVVTIFDIAE